MGYKNPANYTVQSVRTVDVFTQQLIRKYIKTTWGNIVTPNQLLYEVGTKAEILFGEDVVVEIFGLLYPANSKQESQNLAKWPFYSWPSNSRERLCVLFFGL
jgi:hypothetical protein